MVSLVFLRSFGHQVPRDWEVQLNNFMAAKK